MIYFRQKSNLRGRHRDRLSLGQLTYKSNRDGANSIIDSCLPLSQFPTQLFKHLFLQSFSTMRFAQVLSLFTPLLLVSGAAINARAPEADVGGITVFTPPAAETASLHELEKRKPKQTIIIIIIIVRGVAANGAAAFAPATEVETFTSVSTVLPKVTGGIDEFAAFGKGETVTLSSTRSITITTTKEAI